MPGSSQSSEPVASRRTLEMLEQRERVFALPRNKTRDEVWHGYVRGSDAKQLFGRPMPAHMVRQSLVDAIWAFVQPHATASIDDGVLGKRTNQDDVGVGVNEDVRAEVF